MLKLIGFVEATKYNNENIEKIEKIENGIVNSLTDIIYCNWYWIQEWPNKMDRMPQGNHNIMHN